MKNIRLFIIGAGFSAPLGAPTMANFIHQARDLYNSDRTKFSRFNRIFEFQNSLGGASRRYDLDLENIEHLFNLLEWQRYLDHDQSDDYKEFKFLVTETLRQKIDLSAQTRSYRKYKNFPEKWNKKFNERSDQFQNISIYEQFLFTVFNDGSKRDLVNVFVTLNYDCILEHYLKELNINYSVIGLDSIGDLQSDKVYIVKPHGSIDWAIRDDNKVFIDSKTMDPFIIPPSWFKLNEGSNLASSVIRELWRFCGKSISGASEIIILGYSLPETDQYFRSLFAYGLSTNTTLNSITVVDRSENILSKWGTLLKFDRPIVFEDSNHIVGIPKVKDSIIQNKNIKLYNVDISSALYRCTNWIDIRHESIGY